jgi:hypothetical protein
MLVMRRRTHVPAIGSAAIEESFLELALYYLVERK